MFPLKTVRPTSNKEVHSHRLAIISHKYLKVNGEIVSPLYPKKIRKKKASEVEH